MYFSSIANDLIDFLMAFYSNGAGTILENLFFLSYLSQNYQIVASSQLDLVAPM
jgi:hypothetical protein